MRAHTDSTAPAREGRGLQSPAYGVPSPALLARADRGFARFLGQHNEDQVDGADGGEDPQLGQPLAVVVADPQRPPGQHAVDLGRGAGDQDAVAGLPHVQVLHASGGVERGAEPLRGRLTRDRLLAPTARAARLVLLTTRANW
ncbi:hypothetical protein ABTZ57_42335 [Streptomyces sp. NPDC094048]|uniref:hypothetical protein n=1 Tax=Streptomyces sp. NPDC094048 TaxID=3155207 RepID=UPI003318B6D8